MIQENRLLRSSSSPVLHYSVCARRGPAQGKNGRPLVARKIHGHSFTTALTGPSMEKGCAIRNMRERKKG